MNLTPEELQKMLDDAYQKGKSEGNTVYVPMPVAPVTTIQPYPWLTYPTVTYCQTSGGTGEPK